MTTLARDVEAVWCGPHGHRSPVLIGLRWTAADPWSISATFYCGSDTAPDVAWVLGRDLLWDGLHTPVGEGDVEVRPIQDGQQVELVLSSPDGHAVLALDTEPFAEFLAATYHHIPEGQELLWAPMDDELAELLNGSDL